MNESNITYSSPFSNDFKVKSKRKKDIKIPNYKITNHDHQTSDFASKILEEHEKFEEEKEEEENDDFKLLLFISMIILGAIGLYPWFDCDSVGKPSYYYLDYKEWIFGFFLNYLIFNSRAKVQ